MGDYYCVRIWQLKPGASASDLEILAQTGLIEMQRWIPGVRHISLLRTPESFYVMTVRFASYQAYRYWGQMEEEGLDYWERYAAILTQWEQVAHLVTAYEGEMVLDASPK